MKSTTEYKLKQVTDIWNYFILDYKFCSNKVKFNSDVKTNYFGDILGYFSDTIDIVFTESNYHNYPDKFVFTISFLQAIYVQQDLIQEMLEIFKTGIEKGDLKKDPTYSINRDLRNELVGHPIRKFEGRLISSTLFSYQAKNDEIQYLRYHADNNFDFETKTFKIPEIQIRHKEFLEKYLDIILEKLKTILNEFLNELNKFENVIRKNDFKTILKLAELYFEAIFKSEYLYEKLTLLELYDRREEHLRYEKYIDKFYRDLRTQLQDERKFVQEVFEPKPIINSSTEKKDFPEIQIVFTNPSKRNKNKKPEKETYTYELSKIATRRNPSDFDFFGGMLRDKCAKNHLILSELEHMKNNIFNEIEYYTSFNLICEELDEKKSRTANMV